MPQASCTPTIFPNMRIGSKTSCFSSAFEFFDLLELRTSKYLVKHVRMRHLTYAKFGTVKLSLILTFDAWILRFFKPLLKLEDTQIFYFCKVHTSVSGIGVHWTFFPIINHIYLSIYFNPETIIIHKYTMILSKKSETWKWLENWNLVLSLPNFGLQVVWIQSPNTHVCSTE